MRPGIKPLESFGSRHIQRYPYSLSQRLYILLMREIIGIDIRINHRILRFQSHPSCASRSEQ